MTDETVFDLQRLFYPRSVAVVGASSNEDSISGRPIKLLRRYGFPGPVWPVNPKYKAIGGLTCYPSLADLPGVPDVVIVSVRGELVPDVIDRSGAMGAKFGVIFSSGFSEVQGGFNDSELAAIARRHGMHLLGPNCQGLMNMASGIPLSFSASLDTDRRSSGSVAYISQSGAFGFASYAMATDEGVNFRYVVTTGNQADLDFTDIGRYILRDPGVKLLTLYVEGVDRGDKFITMLREARERRMPVAVLKVGISDTAKRAAASHTAALTGDDDVWNALLKQYGAIVLRDSDHIQDMGRLVGAVPPPKGNRVAVLTTSGGAGIIMSDRCSEAGLDVPMFSGNLSARLKKFLPPFGSPANPVDMTAQVINDPQNFKNCLKTVLDSPEVDSVIVIISMITGASGQKMAEDLASVFVNAEKPIACCWLINEEHGGTMIRYLRERGVPLFKSLSRCAYAMGAHWCAVSAQHEDTSVSPLVGGRLESLPEAMTEYDAKRLLARYGIPVTREELVNNPDEAVSAAERIGYPVVVKAMHPDIQHKTEAGIVVLGVSNDDDLRAAFGHVAANAMSSDCGCDFRGVLIQEMVKEGVECIVGVKRDPDFGPVVLVGLGGIFVEVLKDVSMRIAPVNTAMARTMIDELRAHAILGGVRGREPCNVDALADLVSVLSRIACCEPGIAELEINPVFVGPTGVVCADALLVRAGKGGDPV